VESDFLVPLVLSPKSYSRCVLFLYFIKLQTKGREVREFNKEKKRKAQRN
jgi:hypothetical protein